MKVELMKKYIISYVCVASLCVTSLSAHAAADDFMPSYNSAPILTGLADTLDMDNIKVNMWAGEFISHESNLFNTKGDQVQDTSANTVVGASLVGGVEKVWSLNVTTQLEQTTYFNRSDYDGLEGYISAKGTATFSPALSVRSLIKYANTSDYIRNVEDIYQKHALTFGLGTTLSPSPFMDMDVDYTYYTIRRTDEPVKDQEYNEHTIALRPSYAISPFLRAFVQLALTETDPLSNAMNESTSYSASVGLAWAYKDTGSISASVGYKYMDFSSGGTEITDTNSDYAKMTANLSASSALDVNWSAGLNISYAPTYGGSDTSASNSNSIEAYNSSAFIQYKSVAGHFVAKLSPYYNYSVPSADDSYAKYGVGLGVGYEVYEWLKLSAGYTFAVTNYEGESAYSSSTFTFGAAITY